MLPVALAGRQCLHRKEQRGNNVEGCILMRITEPAACCDTGNGAALLRKQANPAIILLAYQQAALLHLTSPHPV